MSDKYNAIAEALKGIESAELAEVKELLKKYDELNDKRFEAFDMVIQQQGDILDEVLEKIKTVKPAEIKLPEQKPFDTTRLEAAIKAEIRSIKLPDVKVPEISLAPVLERIRKLEQDNQSMKNQIDKLLTAKRVPEYDTFGNVIAVRLEN